MKVARRGRSLSNTGRTLARCGVEDGFIIASWRMMLPAKQRDFGVAWLIPIVSIGKPVRGFFPVV